MRVFGMDIRRASRTVEARQTVTANSSDFLDVLGLSAMGSSASDVVVNVDTALGVPAIFGAVNFIAGTMAGLPLNLYRRQKDGHTRITDDPLAMILHDAVNDETSSFEWRKNKFTQALTGGRGLTFIERNKANKIINLWPLDPGKTTIKRRDGKKVYELRDGGLKTYAANEIIDIPFMLKADGVAHRGPIATNRDVIGLAIAATQFGSKFFQNGGVPPFAVTGNFQSAAAMSRAAEDLTTAVRAAAKEKRQALILPTGLEIKPLGTDAEKSQLVELKQFLIEEVARIYSLPPTFLQDLSNGTFSNTEQQDLHFVKHTMKRWVEAFEQELNLKLFGRGSTDLFVEMNMDGLLRGDFKTRMDGYATGIQNAVLTPNEARTMENRPRHTEGEQLLIQGATVPLGSQPIKPTQTEGTNNGT